MDGNVQGYAVKRRIAVSPLAEYPHKTRFHEMAHVVLGHTLKKPIVMTPPSIPRSIQEVEAEGVAFLLCSILDLPGRDESRGYIQSWLRRRSAARRSRRSGFSAQARRFSKPENRSSQADVTQ
jgi:hypothetical protein